MCQKPKFCCLSWVGQGWGGSASLNTANPTQSSTAAPGPAAPAALWKPPHSTFSALPHTHFFFQTHHYKTSFQTIFLCYRRLQTILSGVTVATPSPSHGHCVGKQSFLLAAPRSKPLMLGGGWREKSKASAGFGRIVAADLPPETYTHMGLFHMLPFAILTIFPP